MINNSNSKEIENNINNSINIILNEILKKQETILTKIDCLENRIKNIEKKLDCKYNINIQSDNLKEIKVENLNVPKEEVLKALKYRDYRSVMYIFKYVYKNKINLECAYPIRIINKRSYEYYIDKKWNKDPFGNDSRNILCKNIQNLFIKYNNMEENDDIDDFMTNQKFICKLSDEKEKKNIFKYIIEEIRINNL